MKSKKYNYGGGFTRGAGDGDMTPGKAGMVSMAKDGGLKGFMAGGSVIDYKMYGGTKSKKK
jgi:hypothetical protein